MNSGYVDNRADLYNMLARPGIKGRWKNQIKIFQTHTHAPQRGRGDTPGTPYGADLNNHSELTRRGFRNTWRLLFFMIDRRKIVGVAVHPKQSNIVAKADNVLKVAYLLLIDKIKIAENQMINSCLGCPEQGWCSGTEHDRR